jgi:hypothetical protein
VPVWWFALTSWFWPPHHRSSRIAELRNCSIAEVLIFCRIFSFLLNCLIASRREALLVSSDWHNSDKPGAIARAVHDSHAQAVRVSSPLRLPSTAAGPSDWTRLGRAAGRGGPVRLRQRRQVLLQVPRGSVRRARQLCLLPPPLPPSAPFLPQPPLGSRDAAAVVPQMTCRHGASLSDWGRPPAPSRVWEWAARRSGVAGARNTLARAQTQRVPPPSHRPAGGWRRVDAPGAATQARASQRLSRLVTSALRAGRWQRPAGPRAEPPPSGSPRCSSSTRRPGVPASESLPVLP